MREALDLLSGGQRGLDRAFEAAEQGWNDVKAVEFGARQLQPLGESRRLFEVALRELESRLDQSMQMLKQS